MKNFNKIKYFDKQKGIIEVESGLVIKQLLPIIVEKGWFTFPACVMDKIHLQERLNEEAKSGWRLHSVTCGSVPGGTRQNEYVIFLERDVLDEN